MHVHLFLACEYWIFFSLRPGLVFYAVGPPLYVKTYPSRLEGPNTRFIFQTSSSRKRYLCDSPSKPADLVVARPDDPLISLDFPVLYYCCSWIERLAPFGLLLFR